MNHGIYENVRFLSSSACGPVLPNKLCSQMASSQIVPFLDAKIAPSPEWNGWALQYWLLSLQSKSGELISPTAQFVVLFALEPIYLFSRVTLHHPDEPSWYAKSKEVAKSGNIYRMR